MTLRRKAVLSATLVLLYVGGGFGQQEAPAPASQPSALVADESQASPATAPQSFGRRFPAGWSLSGSGDVLAMWDSNPGLSLEPTTNAGERYMGRFDLSHMGAASSYLLSYIPSFSFYEPTTQLNNTSQMLQQKLSCSLSKSNTLDWQVGAQKYPWYAGSPMANSNLGALVMAVTGINGYDLMSSVTSAQTDLRLHHAIDERSDLLFTASGGVVQYGSSNNTDASLLVLPASKTWDGAAGIAYEYHLDRFRSIGVGANEQYFQFTAQNDHRQVESISIRYSQEFQNKWGFEAGIGPSLMQGADVQALQTNLALSVGVNRTTGRSQLAFYVGRTYLPGLDSGSLTNWSASFSYERALSKRWIGGAFATFARSSSTTIQQQQPPSSDLYNSAIELGYRLGRHLTWIANYGYATESGSLTDYRYVGRQQLLTGPSFEFDSFLRE